MAARPQSGAFTSKLGPEELEYFKEINKKPFSQQAVAFLNAYWPEVHTEAPFIFNVSWEQIKYADMHNKGIQLIYKYDEGNDVDFDIALYFYEILNKFLDDPKNAQWKGYTMSQPEMLTAIKRKQELREKVDVTFDGRMSFLEFLLHQYRAVANPADFCVRSMSQGEEHPEVRKARLALEEVNKRIRAFEEEKARLEEIANSGNGVKALGAKNMLAQLHAGPLAEALNKALITAEAQVRIAIKKFGGGTSGGSASPREGVEANNRNNDGACFWLEADLNQKKARYGAQKK
jgi:hypothetical protein